MAELFEITELVKVAIEDERTGVAFYSRLAEKCERLKETFERLAEEEKIHLKRFEEIYT
ncbi:MAG: ferritin family protein, partial [Planctomycetota bacterium]